MRNPCPSLALVCLAVALPWPVLAQEDSDVQPPPEERPAEQPRKKRRQPEPAKPRGDELPGWAESWPVTFRAAQKGGSLRMTASVTPTALPPGTSEVYALIAIRAPIYPVERQAPLNVALVLDRSDSMRGARLVATKRAARELIGEMDEHDRLSIVGSSRGFHSFLLEVGGGPGIRAERYRRPAL